MFLQTHIQRNHRQNLGSNLINSSNKLNQQQHLNSLHTPSSVRVSKQIRRGKSIANRKIARDPSFDVSNETLDISLTNNSHNNNCNTNKPRYDEKHLTSPRSNNKPSYDYNLSEVQNNCVDKIEESLIVELNNSFELEGCRSRSVDSLPEWNGPTLFPPQIFNQTSNYDFELADNRKQYGERISVELVGDNHSKPSNNLSVNLENEPDSMIKDSQNDDSNHYQGINELSYHEINDGIDDKRQSDTRENHINETRVPELERRENSTPTTPRQVVKRSSIISCSRKNFELFSSFCRNFISYQLETWRLLADSATFLGSLSPVSTPISEINPQRSMCSICHVVQGNVLKFPTRRKVFEDGIESGQAEILAYHNDKSLPQFLTRSSIGRHTFDEQSIMESSPETIMFEGPRYIPFVGIPATPTIVTREINQNIDQVVISNNYNRLAPTAHNSSPRNEYLPDYQHNQTLPQQMQQTPPSHYIELQKNQNSHVFHQTSINEQDLLRENGSSRQIASNYHHLYRASTGIELTDRSGRPQIGDIPSRSQKWQQQRYYQAQPLPPHHHQHHQYQQRKHLQHRHQHNHHHEDRKMIHRTQMAELPPSLSESFDLSLDEKYPIPPPIITDWNKRDSTELSQQHFINEPEASSIKRTASQSRQDFEKRLEINLTRNQSLTMNNSKPIHKQVLSIEKKKNLLLENQLNTGSDSELCSVKREQVLQETGVTRKPSISKPPSIEKINQADANQLGKANCYLSTKEDSRSISPSSIDSSKLLTVGFGRLSKRISSSKLSLAGARRRLWMKQRGLSSLSVQRSEEIAPVDARHLVRQMTNNSLTDSGTESGSWISRSQIVCDPRACFVEGLGQGQIASRQALVSPYLGDIQLSLSDQRGMLEVEVVRARRLHAKAGAKILPSPFVKVYLMKEKKCIAKFKTNAKQHTLDPLYQEKFIFRYDYENCVLQVIVWGDYGKKDRKSLMGISQIQLGELEISNLVIDWYQLFNAPSMASSFVSSKALRQTMLMKEESK